MQLLAKIKKPVTFFRPISSRSAELLAQSNPAPFPFPFAKSSVFTRSPASLHLLPNITGTNWSYLAAQF